MQKSTDNDATHRSIIFNQLSIAAILLAVVRYTQTEISYVLKPKLGIWETGERTSSGQALYSDDFQMTMGLIIKWIPIAEKTDIIFTLQNLNVGSKRGAFRLEMPVILERL